MNFFPDRKRDLRQLSTRIDDIIIRLRFRNNLNSTSRVVKSKAPIISCSRQVYKRFPPPDVFSSTPIK